MDKNIVVEKDGYACSENERYMGAKVFPPIPGIYNMVVPFDFASLYPTTIIAYNIDYHTWVKDDSDIPDVLCNVFEWQEHIACCHDPKVIRKFELTKYIDTEKEKIKKLREKRDKTLCKLRKKEIIEDINNKLKELKPYTDERSDITKTIQKQVSCINRRYRFLKEPKGVLPTIIQNLLDARNNTRKEMKKILKEIDTIDDNINLKFEKKTLYDVLDKRQLAFKVSANSMYGAMGVRKGYLPFMPGAMCTTYMGRTNIEIVADVITNKYDGKLIYGDTDSNYICFPNIKTAQETWDNAIFVADEITKLFPKPIVLEFEEEIYAFFFILSKKRYMYRKCYRDGKIDMTIGKKGVLLARRDNSKFIRDIYESVINKIADNTKRDDILYYILKQINELCSGVKHYNDFVVTKSVGDSGNLIPNIFINEKGVKKIKIGDYTIPYLSEDKNEREEQFNKKNVNNEKDFYLSCLPAQVQLAERMKKRGNRVDSGSRLEYIVCDPENHNGKQYDKIESIDYMIKHREIIKIDYMYYLKALINPLDQVLDVAFGKDIDYQKGFIDNQYKYYIKIKNKLLKELNNITKSNLLFYD
jgi:DNA polymerase elongation subunit (family B)